MIEVTRLNGERFVVNADHIEFLEATPDTVITLDTGRKLVVREPVPEVVKLVLRYRSRAGFRRGSERGAGATRDAMPIERRGAES